jgi:hypothetical protein
MPYNKKCKGKLQKFVGCVNVARSGAGGDAADTPARTGGCIVSYVPASRGCRIVSPDGAVYCHPVPRAKCMHAHELASRGLCGAENTVPFYVGSRHA